MTCKDCVHYELCVDLQDELKEKQVSDITPEFCKYSKDRSKLIESNCKVEDTVYKDNINKYIGKMIIPVTLCMHCKYRTWFAPGYGCGNFNSPFYKAAQEDVAIMTKPYDFCSYGEPSCNV